MHRHHRWGNAGRHGWVVVLLNTMIAIGPVWTGLGIIAFGGWLVRVGWIDWIFVRKGIYDVKRAVEEYRAKQKR